VEEELNDLAEEIQAGKLAIQRVYKELMAPRTQK
jgi:hypothetical protein